MTSQKLGQVLTALGVDHDAKEYPGRRVRVPQRSDSAGDRHPVIF
jgi:hypothetical protein